MAIRYFSSPIKHAEQQIPTRGPPLKHKESLLVPHGNTWVANVVSGRGTLEVPVCGQGRYVAEIGCFYDRVDTSVV